jgi:hypothetical protein
MFVILHALGMFVVDLFKSRSLFEAENLFIRHQFNIALRRGTTSSSTAWQSSRAARMDDQVMAEPAWCGPGSSAGGLPAVASRRLQNLLALEIAKIGQDCEG